MELERSDKLKYNKQIKLKMRLIKRLTFTVLATLVAGCMMAQTGAKLIAKYKAFPNAEYENTTKDQIEEYQKHRNEYAAVGVDIDKVLKKLKKVENVGVELNDEEALTLKQDLDNLQGFEQLYAFNGDLEPEGSADAKQGLNIYSTKDQGFHDLQIYVKKEGNVVTEHVIKVVFIGKTYLVHTVGKFGVDDLKKMMQMDNKAE